VIRLDLDTVTGRPRKPAVRSLLQIAA
jgi:hypothetical protein